MLDFLQHFSLPGMFFATLVLMLAWAWLLLIAIRAAFRFYGRSTWDPPIRDSMISVISAIFALMVAFSAAGIWQDTLQARSAVQREANALENALGVANGLPAELRDTVKSSVINYAKTVVERDWPAMARQADLNDPLYGTSGQVLVHLMDHLSSEVARGQPPAVTSVLLGQLIEARNARLSRLALSTGGLTNAQWIGLLMLVTVALIAVAICHNAHRDVQFISVTLYALAAAAAFFVIVAHDKPFVGAVSVSPAPLQQLATR